MSLWYPYAQMKTLPDPLHVHRAEGPYIYTEEHGKLLDGISSWWCVIHGYSHPELNRAATDQLSQMSHVMLGGLSHQPAQSLAQKLASICPGDLNHVFFADSGSVGVEVSLKMAIQYWINQGVQGKTKFCALRMGYHGDTLMAMSVGDPDDSMHHIWQGALREQFWVERPTGYPTSENLDSALFDLEQTLHKHHGEIAGFIVEPILQAWGGFNAYDPRYLQQARKLCDHYGVLFIFDEVATGFGRTGKLFAAEHANVVPDIMVLSKALTGGYLGLSATIASEKVYRAFYSDDPTKCLMHGPTFMANPLACAIALKSIEIFERENYLDKIKTMESTFRSEMASFQSPQIRAIRIFGASLCLEVYEKKSYFGLQQFAAQRGLWLRPFENYVYAMPAYILTKFEVRKICSTIKEFFRAS